MHYSVINFVYYKVIISIATSYNKVRAKFFCLLPWKPTLGSEGASLGGPDYEDAGLSEQEGNVGNGWNSS